MSVKEELRKARHLMFMEDGKTPRCSFCMGAMHNYIPTKGIFKGKTQKHSWVCDCPAFQKAGIILSMG